MSDEAWEDAGSILRTPRQRAYVCRAIELRRRGGLRSGAPMLWPNDLNDLAKDAKHTPPNEQADNLIEWLATQDARPDQRFTLFTEAWVPNIGSALDNEAVHFIVNHLTGEGLVESDIASDTVTLRLTFKGWERWAEIQRTGNRSKLAFMAMKFGVEQLDDFFDKCLRPAVADTGFELRRNIDDQPAGFINDQMRVDIRRSRFLIADLSTDNSGAYWEAGFAEGIGRPVIYTCSKERWDKGKGTHFDTRNHKTIIWTSDGYEQAAKEIKATIRATLPAEAMVDDPPQPTPRA